MVWRQAGVQAGRFNGERLSAFSCVRMVKRLKNRPDYSAKPYLVNSIQRTPFSEYPLDSHTERFSIARIACYPHAAALPSRSPRYIERSPHCQRFTKRPPAYGSSFRPLRSLSGRSPHAVHSGTLSERSGEARLVLPPHTSTYHLNGSRSPSFNGFSARCVHSRYLLLLMRLARLATNRRTDAVCSRQKNGREKVKTLICRVDSTVHFAAALADCQVALRPPAFSRFGC